MTRGPAGRRLIVVGCGIGGATTALALARAGVPVTVLERAPVIAEVGAGLQLGPNASRVLDRLDVRKHLEEEAVLPDRGVMREISTGRELVSVDFTGGFRERFGAPYSVLHRGDLLSALLAACAETGLVTILPGKELVAIDDDGDQVTVVCADGSEFTADGVVAADGLRSRVRTLLFDPEPPLASQYVIYRATVPRVDGVENAVTLFAGEHHHLMQYPIKGGSMVNIVCSFKSERGEPGSDTWGLPGELRERFADAGEQAAWAVAQLDTEHRWVQFDRDPRPGWSLGRITLTGDAAHAAHQYLAQGAGQAMEDAVVLASLASDESLALDEAFRRFEQARFDRTSTVQRGSRFWGELSHVGGEDAELRNAMLAAIGPQDYDFIDWLYGDGSVPLPVVPHHKDDYRPLDSERVLDAAGGGRGAAERTAS